MRSARLARTMVAVATVVGGIGLAGCAGGSAGPPYEVSLSVISGEGTQAIGVWAPDAEGSWPVAIGLHGSGGSKADWDVLATEVAQQGVVVFVPNYRSTSSVMDITEDVTCGMHYARSVAGDYGGDLDQPFTLVGYSLGANLAMVSKADASESAGGTLDACFEGLPDPDVIVAMEGCYYASQGDNLETMPATGTRLTLVTGDNDQICPAWQSQDAADALRATGYDTTLVTIPGGTHGTPLFFDDSHTPWRQLPADDPGGQQAVRAILDAIEAAR